MSNRYEDIRTGKVVYEAMFELAKSVVNKGSHDPGSYRFYLPFHLIRCVWVYMQRSVKKVTPQKAINDGLVVNDIKVLTGYENKIILAHREALLRNNPALKIELEIPKFDPNEDITHEYLTQEGFEFFPANPINESWYKKGKQVIKMLPENQGFYRKKGKSTKALLFKQDI
jgi:hypothetical protein